MTLFFFICEACDTCSRECERGGRSGTVVIEISLPGILERLPFIGATCPAVTRSYFERAEEYSEPASRYWLSVTPFGPWGLRQFAERFNQFGRTDCAHTAGREDSSCIPQDQRASRDRFVINDTVAGKGLRRLAGQSRPITPASSAMTSRMRQLSAARSLSAVGIWGSAALSLAR